MALHRVLSALSFLMAGWMAISVDARAATTPEIAIAADYNFAVPISVRAAAAAAPAAAATVSGPTNPFATVNDIPPGYLRMYDALDNGSTKIPANIAAKIKNARKQCEKKTGAALRKDCDVFLDDGRFLASQPEGPAKAKLMKSYKAMNNK